MKEYSDLEIDKSHQLRREMLSELKKEFVLIRRFQSPLEQLTNIELMEVIGSIVCKEYNIKLDDLINGGNKKPLPDCRKISAMMIKTVRPRLSYPEMGKFFNRRHSSILLAEREGYAVIQTDKTFSDSVKKIKESINSFGIVKEN